MIPGLRYSCWRYERVRERVREAVAIVRWEKLSALSNGTNPSLVIRPILALQV